MSRIWSGSPEHPSRETSPDPYPGGAMTEEQHERSTAHVGRLVVKIGTSSLVGPDGLVSARRFDRNDGRSMKAELLSERRDVDLATHSCRPMFVRSPWKVRSVEGGGTQRRNGGKERNRRQIIEAVCTRDRSSRAMISLPFLESRLPVGSSAMMMSGSLARARAILTR